MPNRRDQVQAHRYAATRVRSALLHGDPDPVEAPLRQLTTGTVAGVMLAIILLAAAGVFGVVRPQVDWRQQNTLLIAGSTGAMYLYEPERDLLHPVANYTSARLLLGSNMKVKKISDGSLRQAALGAPLGDEGWPDALPAPNRLLSDAWTVCTRETEGQPRAVLAASPARPSTAPTLPESQAVLVRSNEGRYYLIWNGTQVLASERALTALNLDADVAWGVDSEWVKQLPLGGALEKLYVPNDGEPSAVELDGRALRVGELLHDPEGPGGRYWLVHRNGTEQLPDALARLMLDDRVPLEVSANAAGGLPRERMDLAPSTMPGDLPQIQEPDGSSERRFLCATVRPGENPPGTVPVTLEATPPGVPNVAATTDARIFLPAGSGVLAHQAEPDEEGTRPLYLISETGTKYRIPDEATESKLGYANVSPTVLPEALLSLVPNGDALQLRDGTSRSASTSAAASATEGAPQR